MTRALTVPTNSVTRAQVSPKHPLHTTLLQRVSPSRETEHICNPVPLFTPTSWWGWLEHTHSQSVITTGKGPTSVKPGEQGHELYLLMRVARTKGPGQYLDICNKYFWSHKSEIHMEVPMFPLSHYTADILWGMIHLQGIAVHCISISILSPTLLF
jgi:hypothetical protein